MTAEDPDHSAKSTERNPQLWEHLLFTAGPFPLMFVKRWCACQVTGQSAVYVGHKEGCAAGPRQGPRRYDIKARCLALRIPFTQLTLLEPRT